MPKQKKPRKNLRKRTISQHGNAIARHHGYGRATTILLGKVDRLISHVKYGHRKNTTDEYVGIAYLKNFGWKNTYYQHAETVVEVNARRFTKAGKERSYKTRKPIQ